MPGFLADALTWPSNYRYTIAVETAMKLNLPPSVMLTELGQPADGWSRADKKLAMAWIILQKETCKNCGQPLWICRSSNKNLMFSVRTGICYAKAELEKWEVSPRGKKLKKGEHPFIVAQMRNKETPLPSRAEYMAELADE